MSISKLQTLATQAVILIVFSAAGFEVAAALYSWRSGELIPRYLVIAAVLLVAGFILNEVYRRTRVGNLSIARGLD